MFWGISPALDLLEEYKKHNDVTQNQKEINVLIVGGVDCRHVLKSLSRRYRHEKVKFNFYIMEACMETVAKQLLLLLTALQPKECLGLDQKAKVFMELYGNTLVRPYTAKYLTNAAKELVKMITDYNYLTEKISCANIDIKYRERDYLENLVKFWCGRDDFNITDIWDKRLRKYLGVRYDSKVGAFDWDLNMRLHNVGANQICNQEYQSFRSNGIAFSWVETEVSRPNRTMVCAIIPNGNSFAHYGYLGDMETGPFVTFGLNCEDKEFLKSTHGQNSHRATDVTERNIKQMFHELEYQSEYHHTKKNDFQLGCSIIKQEKIVIDVRALEQCFMKIKSSISMEDVTINFLSINILDQMRFKQKYEDQFDVIYFGNNYLKYFEKDIVEKIARDASLLIIEHPIFLVNNRKKELEDYAKQVEDKINGMQLKKIDFDVEKDCNMKFILGNK